MLAEPCGGFGRVPVGQTRARPVLWLAAILCVAGCGGSRDECAAGCPPGQHCYFGSCVPIGDGGEGGDFAGEAEPDVPPEEDRAVEIGDADGDLDVSTEDVPGPDDTLGPDDMPAMDDALTADDAPEPDDAAPDADGPDDDAGDDGAEMEADGGATCGNDVVEPDEECDDGTAFCADCRRTAPSGWTSCVRSDGRTVILQPTTWTGDHLWTEFRDYCRDTIDGLGTPSDATSWGLVAITDTAVRDCLLPLLDGAVQYWVGVYQHASGAEPAGDWYWTGWDGSGWVDVAPLDGTASGMTTVLDEWPAESDCVRLLVVDGAWGLYDYTCTPATAFSGVCSIVF